MNIEILEQMRAVVINDGTIMGLLRVKLDDHQQAFFVGHLTHKVPRYQQGKFFISRITALDYFELHVKYWDMDQEELTVVEENIYTGIHTRSYNDMVEYINS